ncbi:MAG: hypothetical protein IT423_03855 [Pirellulaceae bacterium]|nr:hypothetical protein [Pirellulaceae bacterium]
MARWCEAGLKAGAARRDVTDRQSGPVNDPLFVKALVIQSDDAQLVLITVDAVAIGEIGPIPNSYLPKVRERLERELKIAPANVLVNASHCHGRVVSDLDGPTFEAVAEALKKLEPVKIGFGFGQEDTIMENRRMKLKSGRTADVRHAYSLPPDDEVVETGPIDPQIGVLRLDRLDNSTLAVVYNFACHPIQGVPSGANTADIIGYASKVIEENTSAGTVALFMQGCGGDVNPVFYKDVDHPRSAEPLGNKLGLSTLRALKTIECRVDDRLRVRSELLALPRGDRTERIAELESQQRRLLADLRGTSLNLKTFMALAVKYNLGNEFPSYYAHRYLHDDKLGKDDLRRLDAENRRNMLQYIANIETMEELTRVQTNLALLRKHQASLVAAGKRTVDVEVGAIRIGDLALVTFPGELTVQIGLNIKRSSPHAQTCVAGYTNGYIYYSPTTEQLLNPGNAQEDCDSILAAPWQPIFEQKVSEMLDGL